MPEHSIELFPEAEKMPIFWATLLADEKVVVNQGGTSSGKSQAIIRVLFFYALNVPGIKIEVVAATVPKLTNDTLEIAEGLWRSNKVIAEAVRQFKETTHTFIFHNGSKVIFKSYQTAKDADGPKRDVLYISEARNFDWATAYQLIKRTKKKIFIDYNPVERFWCHDKIIDCQPGPNGKKEFLSVKVIRSWHIHNHFITREMHDEIENIADPEMHKAYARGLTAQLSGMVYPGWVQIEQFPMCEDIIWGKDIGYTNDPTVVVRIGLRPYVIEDGKKRYLPYDYVFDELCYAPGLTSGYVAKLMTENGYKFGQPLYMDHDNTIQRELRGLRIVAVKAVKGKGCIAARVFHLRTMKCAYTKRSTNIHEERKRYMFHVDPKGDVTNEPKEGFDHAMNACEYGAFSHAVRNGIVKGFTYE